MFTVPKFLALASITAASTKLLLPCRNAALRWTLPTITLATTTTYAACYTLKLAHQFHFRRQQTSLAQLIVTLDRFEAAIRRNLLFLNDAQHGASPKLALQQDCFTGNCVRTCMATIRRIHEAVKGLERNYELDERWKEDYVPMEALEDCELFAEQVPEAPVEGAVGVRTIKDLYNIYAYVQSQFLTRLALAVASGLSDFKVCRLTELSKQIHALRDDCMKHIDRITEAKNKVAARPAAKALPVEVANLRSLSTALSMKMLKTAHRYNQLEEILEKCTESYEELNFINHLPTLELSLENISSELAASDEECQRLLILVKKLANKEDPPVVLPPPEKQPEPDSNPTFADQYNPPQKDEFFAVDETEARDSDGDERPPLDELENNIDSKIAKRHFRPVLQQLRERIEPIGVEFREREKRALQDKGIRFEEETEAVPARNTLYSSSDSEQEEEEEKRGKAGRKDKKFQRSVERYDEVRGFLAAKQQMNIFGMMPAVGASVMEEEVLE
uniref:Uncharacterized protein n=1 Tax=Culex tarsalis TaxID=7177 RepID=A0A1Q3FAB5_CULTA